MTQPEKPKLAGKPSVERAPQEKFLEIARAGKDTWNVWRRDNPDEHVDFSGVDFTLNDNKNISFAGFMFGDHVDFSKTTFGDLPEAYRGYPGKAVKKGVSPEGAAIFSGAVFMENTSFNGAAFGDSAIFSIVLFLSETSFIGATFASGARFDYTIFGRAASFGGATFGEVPSFAGTAFKKGGLFDSARFGPGASFSDASFGDWARFVGAWFGKEANFADATFGAEANFADATFGAEASFAGASFGAWASFAGATFGNWGSFDRASFLGFANFCRGDPASFKEVYTDRADNLPETHKSLYLDAMKTTDPAGFEDISFSRTYFGGVADFSGRRFKGSADFSRARFLQPPDFRDTEERDNLDWTAARFGIRGEVGTLPTPGWTTRTETATSLRRLRKIASEIHAHDAERDIFILERMADRGIAWAEWPRRTAASCIQWWRSRPWRKSWPSKDSWPTWLWRSARMVVETPITLIYGFARALIPTVLMFVYRLLSNCGRSVVLPLFWLGACLVGFGSWYASYVAGPLVGKTFDALATFALANAVPFIGSSRQATSDAVGTLFNGSIPDAVYRITLFQGLSSVLLLFLLGLALRAHFKVR